MNTVLRNLHIGKTAPSRHTSGRFSRLFLVVIGCIVLLGSAPVAFGWGAVPRVPAAVAGGEDRLAEAGPTQEKPTTEPSGFTLSDVEERAKTLAGLPYENPEKRVPDFLRELSKPQWDAVRFRPESYLWNDDGLGFKIGFFLPGSIYNRIVDINIVEDGKSARLAFSPSMFSYNDKALAEKVGAASLGFAGFSLRASPVVRDVSDDKNDPDDIAVFLGASYFQSRGRNSSLGLFARGLALDTAVSDGEEFPYFREFWLVKPRQGDESFLLYALMDSPSLTGAYRIRIVPGTSTIMDVDGKVFRRRDAKATLKVGVAPLTSMFLHSELTNGKPGDYRPEVHNSDGLLYATDDGKWFWNPLVNPERLLVTAFPQTNLHGFGLMQRDGNFDHYQDIGERFDRRPSLWVEPKGDWGAGRLELVKIPATEDYQGNIVAYWVFENAGDAQSANTSGAEKPAHTGGGQAFSYTLYWMTPGVSPHDLGRAVATRVVKSGGDDTVQFIVDFEGEDINSLPADTGLTSIVESPETFPLLEKRLEKNLVTGGWRLFMKFRVQREGMVQSLLSARDGSPSVRLTALLKKGENLPAPLTETWVFDLNP